MEARHQQAQQVMAEFFSHGCRLSGTYDARQKSLGDVIYDTTNSYLTVESAYISPIERPAEILANYPMVTLIKAELTFALAMHENDALRRDQKYGSYLGPKLTPVFLTVPFFTLSGYLRLPGRVDPRVLLSSQTESFMTLLDVTAHITNRPEINYQGAAALINKTKISFLGVDTI